VYAVLPPLLYDRAWKSVAVRMCTYNLPSSCKKHSTFDDVKFGSS